MELGEPDESGRRRPVVIKGSEHILPAQVAIVGLGTAANPLIANTTPGLKTDSKGLIVTDPTTMRTSKRGVFAGGDVVSGGATVVLAMGAGRKARRLLMSILPAGLGRELVVPQKNGRQGCPCRRPSLGCLELTSVLLNLC